MNDLQAEAIAAFATPAALSVTGPARIALAVRFRFGEAVPIALAAELTSEQAAEAEGAGLRLLSSEAAVSEQADTWILVLGDVPAPYGALKLEELALPGDKQTRVGKQLYFMERDSVIFPAEIRPEGGLTASLSLDRERHLLDHVFARLVPKGYRGQAYPFPYSGFYNAFPKAFGPIDSFGFRNAVESTSLAERGNDHVAIAVFGGSSAWSPCCLHDETFFSLLETRLNAHLKERPGPIRRVSVLNFAISGYTVLNELITYLLFCHRLRPEIVVTHDLFNDLAHGVRTDGYLLAKHDMTYLPDIEQWAAILLGTQDPKPQSPSLGGLRNSPQAIVRAYLRRKKQFSQVVEGLGGQFVYGVQPAWAGKPLSDREKVRLQSIRDAAPEMRAFYDGIERMYEMARTALAKAPPAHYVDLHGAFCALGTQDEVFVDHAHLLPAGDAKVAGLYYEEIVNRVLPNIKMRRDES